MRRCNTDLLSLYLDGELSWQRRREVDRHLEGCERCQKELESLRRVDSIVLRWSKSRTRVPPRTEARIMRSVVRRSRLRPVLAISRVIPAALGSSIAALLVLMSASQGWLYRNPAPQSSAAGSRSVAKIIKKQSAPLYKARATSAMFGVRSTAQTDQAPRRRSISYVE